MGTQPEQIKSVENSVCRYFDSAPPAEGKNSLTYDQLYARLCYQIEYLLRTSQERLWQGLYRIDVAEDKVKTAFAAGSLTEISAALAKLIIEREIQKVELRAKYKSDG